MARRSLPVLLAALLLAALLPSARACFSLVVGRGATADGSAYIGRTVDYGSAVYTNNVAVVAPRAGPLRLKSVANALELDLPPGGLGYQGLLAAGGHEVATGSNSAGVAVSATQTFYNSDAAYAADPLDAERGLHEEEMAAYVLPQAKTAREGVQVRAGGAPGCPCMGGCRACPAGAAGASGAALAAAGSSCSDVW